MKRKFYKMAVSKKFAGIMIIPIIIISLFVLTRGSEPITSELNYVEYSTVGKDAGSVVPASCDSNDWSGSYCGGAYYGSACRTAANTSYCNRTGLTCEYISPITGTFAHSGSHYRNDCTTPCPSGVGRYDPYFDPNKTGCIPPPPTVQLYFN